LAGAATWGRAAGAVLTACVAARSGGTLVFDAIIFMQFYKYRYAKPKELRAFDSGSDDAST
jgi:hypothetical protein